MKTFSNIFVSFKTFQGFRKRSIAVFAQKNEQSIHTTYHKINAKETEISTHLLMVVTDFV